MHPTRLDQLICKDCKFRRAGHRVWLCHAIADNPVPLMQRHRQKTCPLFKPTLWRRLKNFIQDILMEW